MRRGYAFATLVAGMMSVTSNAFAAAPTTPSERLSETLKIQAQHIFDVSDADHDRRLNHDEQESAARRAYKAFKQLTADNLLGGPRKPLNVAEPTLLNPNSVTADEFIEYFQLRAAQYDAQLRAMRIARGRQPSYPVVVNALPTAVPSHMRQSHRGLAVQHQHFHQFHPQMPQSHFSPRVVTMHVGSSHHNGMGHNGHVAHAGGHHHR